MKFVIMNNGTIPGVGVKGPVLTPRSYDIHQVLKWIVSGVDIREVMEDGSYRKLIFNDERLMQELGKNLDDTRQEKIAVEEEVKKMEKERRIVPKEKPKNKKVQFVPVMDEENKKIEPVKEEAKKEEPKEEKALFPIDNLEKPE